MRNVNDAEFLAKMVALSKVFSSRSHEYRKKENRIKTKTSYNLRMSTVCTFTGVITLIIAVTQLVFGVIFVKHYLKLRNEGAFNFLNGASGCPNQG